MREPAQIADEATEAFSEILSRGAIGPKRRKMVLPYLRAAVVHALIDMENLIESRKGQT